MFKFATIGKLTLISLSTWSFLRFQLLLLDELLATLTVVYFGMKLAKLSARFPAKSDVPDS